MLIDAALPTDKRLATALYLMWKCAARWDDVFHLTKKSLIMVDHAQSRLVIEWGRTKTTRSDPFRVSGWTVVDELRMPRMIEIVEEVFSSLRRDEPLTTTRTRQLARWLKSFRETSTLTAHSFKRGAIGVLIEQAAAGNLDLRLIPIMAKHKDALHDFPVTTLRYAPSKINLALAIGTQHATRLL
jgi:hypothetical protein